MSTLTPQQIAERCAEILWPDDRAPQGMGMELVEIGPGTARLRMAVREDSRSLGFAVEEIVAAMTGDGRMAALFARHGVTWQPAAATQSIG